MHKPVPDYRAERHGFFFRGEYEMRRILAVCGTSLDIFFERLHHSWTLVLENAVNSVLSP